MSTDSSSPKLQDSEKTKAPKRSGRRVWTVAAAVVIMLAGAGYLLSQRSTKPSGAGGKGKGGRNGAGGPIPVAAETVKQGNIGVYVNALGTVTPVYTVTVTSRVGGELKEVHYHEGEMVHKGELLAVIDPRPFQATVLQAQGQFERDAAMLSNARIDLARYQKAFEQHAIPEQQLATQQATVSQDEGTAKIDEGNLDAAKVNLDYSRITAPIDGRVGLRQVDPGNIVAANGTAALLTITQLQPITVIFTMAEDYISEVATQLRAGHKLRVDALDRDDQTELAQGTVLTLDNQIDTTTGTVRVRATFSNRDFKLFPNEFVNARLLVRTLNSVNLIPTAAIQRNNDVAFVYVIDGTSAVHSRDINIATTDGNTAAVTGVKPGERLVTDGFDKLQEGSKVAMRKAVAPANKQGGAAVNDQTQAAANANAGGSNSSNTPAAQGDSTTHVNTNQTDAGQQNTQSTGTQSTGPKSPGRGGHGSAPRQR